MAKLFDGFIDRKYTFMFRYKGEVDKKTLEPVFTHEYSVVTTNDVAAIKYAELHLKKHDYYDFIMTGRKKV